MLALAPAYRFGWYSIVLLATALMAVAVAWRAWRYRRAPGAAYLFVMEVAAAVWSVTGAFEAAATDLGAKVLWSQLSYLGIGATPPSFLLFALDYSHHGRRLRPRLVALIYLCPSLTFLVAATNGVHHWLWPTVTLDPLRNVAYYGHGPWWWAQVVYYYTLSVWGLGTLLAALFRSHRYYRSRLALLIIAALLPVIGNLCYAFDLLPLRGYDWTPVALAVTGGAMLWGVYRQRIFDLLPVARTLLFECLGDGVLVVDAAGRIADANASAQALLDTGGAALVGRAARDVLASWGAEIPLQCDEPTAVEAALGRRELRLMDVRVSPLVSRSGERIGRLVVLHDITERKRAEEALRDLNATLEELVVARTAEIEAEREKSETILRSAGAALALIGPDLCVRYANAAFAALTGHAEDEALGRSVTTLGAWPETPGLQQAIAATLAEGQVWRGDIRGTRKDGQLYDATLTVSPVRGEGGRVSGYVASYLDISERRRLEEARAQFINNVAHSFRTPLTAIKLCTYMLQKTSDPQVRAEYLESLARQAEQFEQLVQDVVTLSMLDSSQGVEGMCELLSVGEVAERAVARCRLQAVEAGLTLELVTPPADLPLVEGVASWLLQALEELVKNALLYTPSPGQVRVGVELAERDGRPWVALVVRDSGPGIAPDELPRLFERFYRGSLMETGHILGTGLGLPIVERVAQLHGGQAAVESMPGQGSTFRLWLPAARV
jgi:PAS domain S-box-containing protein